MGESRPTARLPEPILVAILIVSWLKRQELTGKRRQRGPRNRRQLQDLSSDTLNCKQNPKATGTSRSSWRHYKHACSRQAQPAAGI